MGTLKNIFVFLCLFGIVSLILGHDYDIDMESLEVLYLDPTYGTLDAKVSLHNETTKVFNANGSLFQKISPKNDISISARGYVLAGGEYRPVPYRVNFTFCQAYKHIYTMLIRPFKYQTNIPGSCPVSPGKYYIHNFVPNVYMLPTSLPATWERMMLYVNGSNNSGDLVGSLKAYGRVIHNRKQSKKHRKKLSKEQLSRLIEMLKIM